MRCNCCGCGGDTRGGMCFPCVMVSEQEHTEHHRQVNAGTAEPH